MSRGTPLGFVVDTGDLVELSPEQEEVLDAEIEEALEAAASGGGWVGCCADDGIEAYDVISGELVGFIPVSSGEGPRLAAGLRARHQRVATARRSGKRQARGGARRRVRQSRTPMPSELQALVSTIGDEGGGGGAGRFLTALLPGVIPLASQALPGAGTAIRRGRINRLRRVAARGGPRAERAQERLALLEQREEAHLARQAPPQVAPGGFPQVAPGGFPQAAPPAFAAAPPAFAAAPPAPTAAPPAPTAASPAPGQGGGFLQSFLPSTAPGPSQGGGFLQNFLSPRVGQGPTPESTMSGLFNSIYGGSVVGNDQQELASYWNPDFEPEGIGSDDPGDLDDIQELIMCDQEIAAIEQEIEDDDELETIGSEEEIGNIFRRRRNRGARLANRQARLERRRQRAESRGRGRRAARLQARQARVATLQRGGTRREARGAKRAVRQGARQDRRQARQTRRQDRRAARRGTAPASRRGTAPASRRGTSIDDVMAFAPGLPPEGRLVVLPLQRNDSSVYKFSLKVGTKTTAEDTQAWKSDGIAYAELRLIGALVEVQAFAAGTGNLLGAEITQFLPDGRVSAIYGPQVGLADPHGFSTLAATANNDYATFFMRLIVMGLRDKGRIEKTNRVQGVLKVFAPAQAAGDFTGQYTFAAVCDVLEDDAAANSQ